MTLFERIESPRRQARLALNRHASWYTWSTESLRFLRSWQGYVTKLPTPLLISLPGDPSYPYTYSLRLSSIRDRSLARELTHMVLGLCQMRPAARVLLFHNLLNENLDGQGIHFLFAGFRAALVRMTGDPNCALYAPLDAADRKDFALHADLYIPPILFNVFDHVSADGSGASVFLRTSTLRELLPSVPGLPVSVRRTIVARLSEPVVEDGFDQFFDLLHGEGHPWTQPLQKRMKAAQFRIKLYRGQGYLIHDRLWLHGREALVARVGNRRLHRFIFNPVLGGREDRVDK
jgi:hypothetical protein